MQDRTEFLNSSRTFEREPFADKVSVAFQDTPIVGSGKNISETGVYFIADGEIRVEVTLGDRVVRGRLVRVENHGANKTGLAVRFLDGEFDDETEG